MKKLLCMILLLALCAPLAAAEGAFPSFSTTDMEGNGVTQEIFADYDLTVVNVWATWCGYCVEEMPGFAELTAMLPENVNFITLCTDASDEWALTEEILRTSGANFQTLVVNDEINEYLLSQVYAYPTTLFLNSEGEPVAEPIVGVPSLEDPVSGYYGVITGVLRLMGK